MKTGLNKAIIAIGLCLAALLFVGTARAEDAQQVAQELVSGLDIPADVASTLVSGQGTLGERINGALANGSITQKQFDIISNRFLALPDGKRYAIKGGWDAGKGINPETLHNIVNPQDPGSVRQHVKDLRDQGLTKDQIAARLKAEGVAPDHIKNILYGQGVSGAAGGSQRGEHLKDIRDSGDQAKVDKAHERYQGRKAEPSRVDKAKDNPQRAKNIRDNRKDNNQATSNFTPRTSKPAVRGAAQRRR